MNDSIPVPKPTPAELELLGVLWSRGPSTVRQIWEALPNAETTGYTTVLKLLQIMHAKNLVARDDSERAHVYRAAASEGATQGVLVEDLMDRAFSGSASKLVMRALSNSAASPEELAAIRRVLDELEGDES